MYHIAADTGCDLFELKDVSFATAPLSISTNSEQFVDDTNLDCARMIEHLLAYKGRSYTSCPSTEEWLKAFLPADGTIPDELYVVTLTSGLSGTYNSAMLAKEQLVKKYPAMKVLVVDSLSVGPEMVLILEEIARLKKDDRNFEQVSEAISAYCAKTRLFFAFRSLHNLAQNGRVNKLVAAAAGALGISVIGTANAEGQIHSLGKARGDKKVIGSFLKEMQEAGWKGGRVSISQTENPALADALKQAILEVYPHTDIEIHPVRGLCSYYCERGGVCVACETV